MIPLFTLKEVAIYLRMTERNLRQKMAEGKINYLKEDGKNGRIKFTEKHIQDYVLKI